MKIIIEMTEQDKEEANPELPALIANLIAHNYKGEGDINIEVNFVEDKT